MSQLDHVLLQWSFSPPEYFEQRIEIGAAHHSVEIDVGKILARIDGEHFQRDPSMPETLHNELLARFRAAQLLTHRPFELSGSSMVEVFKDGHTNRLIAPLTGVIAIGSVGSVGVIITDPTTGEVLYDSRRERRDSIKSLGMVSKTRVAMQPEGLSTGI
ncbi:hypothetical protein VAR608DRAFT_5588 [Variovorax sp. HW608]|uniref:hypothetical protein n=1 Tax=Variovorax sp. HW608 TaxID=1034889 RepID=UPI00081FEECE|nr:hypothetical protein [Variovorax sp. HW608]SCK54624.1 hypothetical protein VAR608DRAFT_5588 [Variovorax sp. HW608]